MPKEILAADNIILDCKPVDKWDAIEICGNILVDNGYVTPEYIDDMKERERSTSVYIGNHVAIPHGLVTSDEKISTFSGSIHARAIFDKISLCSSRFPAIPIKI